MGGAPETARTRRSISDHGLALAVYVLYLVGFFNGLTAVIGAVIAYMQSERADEIAQTHFRFQVKTFLIGLLYLFIAAITFHVGIGAHGAAVVGGVDADPLHQGPARLERGRADRRPGFLAVRLSRPERRRVPLFDSTAEETPMFRSRRARACEGSHVAAALASATPSAERAGLGADSPPASR